MLWILLLLTITTTFADSYTQAINKLNSLNTTYQYLYDIHNIDNLNIPPFDSNTHDYQNYKLNHPSSELNEIISLLEHSKENPDALMTLGDLYFFGNFSLPTNYTRAKMYYEQAVDLKPNGHGYFMLGFIHSTGLFGEIPIDSEKGLLYYHFGMELGDVNALLAMAYKTFKGIGVPSNCDLALTYYTKLANMGFEWLQENRTKDIDYNIRISDFNGGIYGEKMSETESSIQIQSKLYNDIRTEFEEKNLNTNDHEYVKLYYNGMEYFKGDYFTPSNYQKAFEEFQQCVELGDEIYGARNYKNIDVLDKHFLSWCQISLARMYYKGLGVDTDFIKAEQLFNISLKVQPSSEAYVYLGKIEEARNYTKAMNYYAEAVKKKSSEGNLRIALLLAKLHGDPHKVDHGKNIYNYMRNAVYYGNTDALYYLADYLQSGLNIQVNTDLDIGCPNIIFYYRTFITRLSSFYAPHLKYSFEELIKGNYKNALMGYAIGAEQGFEPAQTSAAYLLYQLQPLYSKETKTFSQNRIELAIRYLERASQQSNIDATILLGDLYSKTDYNKAFNYYRIASDKHSSHGAFKLGEMYEYGDSVNNSVDYFLAKRHYDNSLQYKERLEVNKKSHSKAHINWALLRLRFKYLFNHKSMKEDENGWLNAFKKIGNKNKQDDSQKEKITRADDHHEGTSYNNNYVEDYDVGDYLVIALTFLFFVVFFVQNIFRQIRRMRGGAQREGDNRNDFHFRRGNFEFHFFAI